MSKHTPGPWVLRPSNAERWSCIVMPENNCRHPYDNVAYIQEMHEDKCTNKGAHMANARLIAAAPELLEALQILVDDAHPMLYQHRKANARAAIAKAIGEQS